MDRQAAKTELAELGDAIAIMAVRLGSMATGVSVEFIEFRERLAAEYVSVAESYSEKIRELLGRMDDVLKKASV